MITLTCLSGRFVTVTLAIPGTGSLTEKSSDNLNTALGLSAIASLPVTEISGG
ncbi:MAG: hypothetical protein F6K41_36880 [Symploca sp. SIO3E6]|nr:hypothetical protein [Caldora sp. SIO3E6]